MSSVSTLPRGLLDWFPWLWSQRLFAGPSATPPGAVSARAWMLLVFLPALLLYPRLNFPLLEPDESRYAQIPREMLDRGDLITPVLEGEPYLDKPPLFYWLIAGSYRLFGVADWSARLVPAVSLHLTVLTLFMLGRRLLGNAAALRGAILLCLAPAFISMGRLLLIDSLLTLWVTVSLLAGFEAVRGPRLHRGWWLLTAFACGLGVLTKGPVALVLLIPPLWLQRRLAGTRCPISWGNMVLVAMVVAALNLPWYVALSLRIPEFVWIFFWEHHVLRYLGTFAHEQGFWYYGPVVVLGMLPGSLLLWSLLRLLISRQETDAAYRPTELGFCLLASGWCVFFFTLSTCKLPTYVMPALPPLCLALGWVLTRLPAWANSAWPGRVGLVMVMVLVVVNHVALPWYAGYRNPLDRAGAVQQLCADRAVPVICYPRDCNTVGFYLGRFDIHTYRSKEIEDLRDLVRQHPRVVILCTHRNSFEGLVQLLPPEVHVVQRLHRGLEDIPGIPPRWMKTVRDFLGRTALGLGDVAVVQPRGAPPPPWGGEEMAEPPPRPKLKGPGADSHRN